MVQASLFDQAEQRKQEGIELVYRHADTDWKRAAAEKLFEVASRMRLFTADDILMPLEAEGIVTGDNRAIAAVFQAAARMNLIKTTDIFVTCKRKSRHHAPIRQWESNMLQKGAM